MKTKNEWVKNDFGRILIFDNERIASYYRSKFFPDQPVRIEPYNDGYALLLIYDQENVAAC